MDYYDDTIAVNLSDDEDVKCSISGNEGDNVNHDSQCDQTKSTNMNVDDGQFIRITDLTVDQIRGLKFGSEEEACDFYEKYAKHIGFVVRKNEVHRNVVKEVIKREFVCNKQGLRNKRHLLRVDRKRNHRHITRTNCKTKLCVQYNFKKSGWIVTYFEENHYHELTPSKYVHLFPTYRGVTDADKAQVDVLCSCGIRTCHIMWSMLAQKGGYATIGFATKDLYNHFDSKTLNEIKDGDVVAALSYLHGKVDNDPILYAKFSTTSDGRLKQLYWADGCSRSDFLCFGDVLAFCTTYKKKYNYPLVIFSRCKHHSQIIIFGCALVSDETIEIYKWVLQSFLEAMGNKHPKAIVTDRDGAMREAIKQIFPSTCYRLCAWNLNKKACENVKNSPFLEDFKKAMYSNFTPDEYECFWTKMVYKHELVGKGWVKTYEIRTLWVTAYFRDKFFGRIRTISQCESINSIMKTYVRRKYNIFEFIHNFEVALRGYRNNELVADFKSQFSESVLTTCFQNIEKYDAKNLYNSNLEEVEEQIGKVVALIVSK